MWQTQKFVNNYEKISNCTPTFLKKDKTLRKSTLFLHSTSPGLIVLLNPFLNDCLKRFKMRQRTEIKDDTARWCSVLGSYIMGNKIRFGYFYLAEKALNNIFNIETLKQHVPTLVGICFRNLSLKYWLKYTETVVNYEISTFIWILSNIY